MEFSILGNPIFPADLNINSYYYHMVVKVIEPSVKREERVSLDRRTSHYDSYDIRRLADALEYVTKGGVRGADLHEQLQNIERRIAHLYDQMSYTKEPFSPGIAKVHLKGGFAEADRVRKLLNEKEELESSLRDAERTYGEVADSIKEVMLAKLAGNLPSSERAEAHRSLLSRGTSPVVDVYYDGGEKVLVLDDTIGRILEVEGHVRLPNNPIISPNGNPETERAATNLCIAEAPDHSVIGIYRGYGRSICGRHEGKSGSFPVSFKEDDVTPKPLPREPIIRSRGKEEGFGIEDGRIVRYNGGYFVALVAARIPDKHGTTMYSGIGIKLSLDLKVEEKFRFEGIPHFVKDFVPKGKFGELYVMGLRASPPSKVKDRDGYKRFYREHPGIRIAVSKDLKHWKIIDGPYDGDVLRPLVGENKIGGGAPPVREEEGLFEPIHAVRGEGTPRRLYSGRVVLFDAEDPLKAIGMTPDFLVPEQDYEMNDEYAIDHVFPMGAVRRKFEIRGKRRRGHIVSAGTADIHSSLYFVLVDYLMDIMRPLDKFEFSKS